MKPATYSKLYIQAVFAVHKRTPVLNRQIREDIYRYMAGIITNKDNKCIIINGVEDHVHILIGLNPKNSISDLVKELKRCTALYINEKKMIRGNFYWQAGYGVFSYSRSHLERVYKYIENQEAHHKKTTFRQEYVEFLKKFEIKFDENYLFEF